jgi:hypothetical protein
MRPKFGPLTRFLAAVYVISGVGSGIVGVNSGHPTTPGSGDIKGILLLMALGFLVVGIGLWAEFLWAWWVGAAAALFTVGMGAVLGIELGGLLVWSAFLILFIVSAIQGFHGTEPPTPRWRGAPEGRDG